MKKKVFITYFVISFLTGVIILVTAQTYERKPLPRLEKPSLVVKKSKRQLQVFDDKKLIRTYPIALGFTPKGDKEIEGDGKTPEGNFYIFTKNPNSAFYLSLGVSYPSIDDAQRGLKEKIITQEEHDLIVKAINAKEMPPQNTALGGEIYIHGGGKDSDWTAGCAALVNEDMKELFDAIEIGTEVKIEP
jgi:murein L,D-transpeptidase YafK